MRPSGSTLLLGVALLSCASAPLAPVQPAAQAALVPVAAAPWKHTPPPSPLAATPVPAVSRLTLPNGLRVVVVEHHRRPLVMVSLLLPRGALSDPPESAGLTYLAVNLASDYYEHSPDGEPLLEEKSFRRQVAELGGAASVAVDSDFSMIRISGYRQDASVYLRMIAEAVARPRHGSQTFRARRNAAFNAIEDLESSDPDALRQVIGEAAFGAGQSYSRSPWGDQESLAVMGLEDVVTQQQAVFVPEGATLLVVGDVRADQMLAAARSAFGRWRGASTPLPRVVPLPSKSRAGDIGYLERHSASTLVVCATRPLQDLRVSDAALDVLAAMLGQGLGSRLGTTLREQNGLTYWAEAEIVHRQQSRAFVACSALRADQSQEGVRLFRQVLNVARDALPSAEEVKRAKARRLAELDEAYGDMLHASETWTKAIVIGSGSPRLAEEWAEIEKVTAEDIQKVARVVLKANTIRWVVSGDRRAASRATEANSLGRLYVPK